MRKPLFEKFLNPYSVLVRAVEREIPLINNPKADPDLRLLAQNCLAKAPIHRLSTVKWEDFSKPEIADPLDSARRRIASHKVAAAQMLRSQSNQHDDVLSTQIFALRTSIFSAVVSITKSESLPRYSTQIMRESQPYLLRVLFEPSERFGNGFFFAAYCQGDVLDAKANLHELRIWACASPKRETIPAEPDSTVNHKVIRGALIEQDVWLHIQESLLVGYADALEIEPENLDTLQWLTIGRDK